MQSIAADNTQSHSPVNNLVPPDLAAALDAQERLAASFLAAARAAKSKRRLEELRVGYRRASVALDLYTNMILAGAQ